MKNDDRLEMDKPNSLSFEQCLPDPHYINLWKKEYTETKTYITLIVELNEDEAKKLGKSLSELEKLLVEHNIPINTIERKTKTLYHKINVTGTFEGKTSYEITARRALSDWASHSLQVELRAGKENHEDGRLPELVSIIKEYLLPKEKG